MLRPEGLPLAIALALTAGLVGALGLGFWLGLIVGIQKLAWHDLNEEEAT